jgi:hypothetical protein
VIEARGTPGDGAMAVAAFLGRGEMVAWHCRGSHPDMAGATCVSSSNEIRVLDSLRREGDRGMACITIIIAGDVSLNLALGSHSIVAAETGPKRLRVVHAHDRGKGIQRVAELAVVLGRNMSRGPRDGADP